MIKIVYNEKTEVENLTDFFGAPLKYGDKVIAICSRGYKTKAFYVWTTPSGSTDKVLCIGRTTLERPYRGVIKYDWVVKNPRDKDDEELSINSLKLNNPF